MESEQFFGRYGVKAARGHSMKWSKKFVTKDIEDLSSIRVIAELNRMSEYVVNSDSVHEF